MLNMLALRDVLKHPKKPFLERKGRVYMSLT